MSKGEVYSTVNDDVSEILAHLHNVKEKPGGGWMALCPAHEDRKRSLSIDVGRDGKLLLKCFSGCEFQSIMDALNLPRRPNIQPRPPERIVATYDYRDETGNLRYQAVRYEPKRFTQRHPNGGAWDWNLNGVERLPYRLPELLRADKEAWHFIPEGEKDVDAMLAAGFSASTNSEGAGNWRPELNHWYLGRRVCVLLDNDPDQKIRDKRADLMRRNLTGIASEVEVRLIPGLPEKGDISDWLAEGHDPQTLYGLLGLGVPPSPNGLVLAGSLASAIQPERVTWLWNGRLALGKISMLDGNPGLGKSTLLLDIAARISTGVPFPGQSSRREPAGVVVMSAEDGEADTIVPRLRAAGADLDRVYILRGTVAADGTTLGITIPTDLPVIRTAIETMQAALVIVDPLMAYFGPEINANKDQDVRRALAPFAAMLEETGCAAWLVRHLTKGESKEALYRGGGSIGIIGAARFGSMVARDPDDDEARIVAVIKCNIGPEPPSLRYALEGVPNTDVARVVWDNEAARWTAAGLLDMAGSDEERQARSECEQWLYDLLLPGPVTRKEVMRQGKSEGFNDKTIYRAKAKIGAGDRREGGIAEQGYGVWFLDRPTNVPYVPDTRHVSTLDTLGTLDPYTNLYIKRERESDEGSMNGGPNVPSVPSVPNVQGIGKLGNVSEELPWNDVPWNDEEETR